MSTDPDFIHFKLGENPHSQYLRHVLTAHFNYERLRGTRRFFVGVLALLGAGLWLLTLWPAAISPHTKSVGLELWGLCMMATLVTATLELKWYRRRAQLMRDNQRPDEREPSP